MSSINRVLLVEDSPGDARLVQEYLDERFGDQCEVRRASTLAEGLLSLQSAPVDVVLLDLGLPDSTGLATFFAINAFAPDTPVVILTGDDDEDAAQGALHAGAEDYLTKRHADSVALLRAMRHAVHRRKLSGRLRDSEARYRTIVETAEEGIAQVDSGGIIRIANARMACLLNPDGGDASGVNPLVGRNLADFVAPEHAPALGRLMATPLGKRTSLELQLPRSDRDSAWVVAAAGRMATEPDADPDVVLMLTDISGRRLAEVELQVLKDGLEALVAERTAELRELNSSLEAFNYTVAHDLRTPLNGILGFATIMRGDRQDPLPATHQRRLEIIEQSARSMDELIGSLLTLARLGRHEMAIAPLDLSALAQAAARNLAMAEPQRVVHWQIEPNLVAAGDPTLVGVVVNNLLQNAWKYSAQAAPARIHFGQVPPQPARPTVYFVRDNGIGIDMAAASGLFSPFHRLPEAKGIAGNGIGLAAARRAVERHGGTVWAEGEPGLGATFFFSLGAAPTLTP